MPRLALLGGTFVIAITLLALIVGRVVRERDGESGPRSGSPIDPSASAASADHQGFLYGRVTADNGTVYEGRLRFGGGEEAFWGDYFNATKDENRWAAHVPDGRLETRRPLEIFGIEIAQRKQEIDLARPFMARLGDIERIEPKGSDLRVTLKSGTVVVLDRFAADDFADGLRIWDGTHGKLDLGERQIRSIDLLPSAGGGGTVRRLHGTVRTRQGGFTGFVQWNRRKGVGSDELSGRAADGQIRLRFDGLRSIARASATSSTVTLLDGRELVLSGSHDVGEGNRGLYVDDRRYGRVLVSWDAFERVDFADAGSGPAYQSFPPGRPLAGAVVARDGRSFAGRLVFDLDESETTETLDAPAGGVDYTIPFGLISSIRPPDPKAGGAARARLTLHSGEGLELEGEGDLGQTNAGLLIFLDDGSPEYVAWSEVERIDLDRPEAMYPPIAPDES